jgi:transposase
LLRFLESNVTSTESSRSRCRGPSPGSRFTALFEALVIDWLQEASFSAVTRQLSLRGDQVEGIQERAVRRGLARRKRQQPRRIGVDETSFRKRVEYITVVNDLDQNKVLWIGDDRRKNGSCSTSSTSHNISVEL